MTLRIAAAFTSKSRLGIVCCTYCSIWYSAPGYEGNRKIQCNFVDGKHDGLYKVWDKDGSMMCEATLEKGKIVSVRLHRLDVTIILDDELARKALKEQMDRDLEYFKTMEEQI